MFWRKKKPDPEVLKLQQLCHDLRNEKDNLHRELRAAKNQVEYLVRTIREMDDKIFQMGQCSGWEQMRRYFIPLQEGMTSRKVIESRRITELLLPELNDTYAPGQIEDKR